MSSASGPTNVRSNTETDTCLLQVQKIKTKRGTVNVMWDNAASLCFVTNSTAKEQNLKGKKVHLSIIKIGAQDEKINTMKFILPLIDAQGQTVLIEHTDYFRHQKREHRESGKLVKRRVKGRYRKTSGTRRRFDWV